MYHSVYCTVSLLSLPCSRGNRDDFSCSILGALLYRTPAKGVSLSGIDWAEVEEEVDLVALFYLGSGAGARRGGCGGWSFLSLGRVLHACSTAPALARAFQRSTARLSVGRLQLRFKGVIRAGRRRGQMTGVMAGWLQRCIATRRMGE